jgi:hypothetical protein
MISMKEAMRLPYEAIQNASGEAQTTSYSLTKRSIGAGGLIFFVLAAAAFIWMYPELKRYLRIQRM